MRIRNYVLLWTIAILGAITVLSLVIGYSNIKNEYNYLFLSEVKDASSNMQAAVSELMRNFSGGIYNYVLLATHENSVEKILAEMKNQFGSNWSFITINSTNYIYPNNVRVTNFVASSRPWYISSLSNPNQLVGNEFYSPTLNATVVTLSIAFKRKKSLLVGGLIFKQDQFFNMISSKLSGAPFFVLKNDKIVYPTGKKREVTNINLKKNLLKFDGELYRTYEENYDHVVNMAGIQSNMNYKLMFLIPTASLTKKIESSFWMILLLLLIADGGAFLVLFLIIEHIRKSVESLAKLSSSFDVSNTIFEPDPLLEKQAQKFRETRTTYDKLIDLFQELNAHVEELKATNEELESSYEDVENLSNTLARESVELKELSRASKLIALSTNINEAAEILLEKIANIYDCDGVKLLEISDKGLKQVSTRGTQFETPNMSQFNEKIAVGRNIFTSWNGKNFAIVPILFESQPIAVIVMMFRKAIPNEHEIESISNFSVHFASLLNSQRMLAKLKNSYIYLAGRLAELSELYDYETGSHVHRVGKYSEFIAKELGMSQNFVNDIGIYAMIHDIGKLKVPREILTKNGTLTKEEFEEIKKHTIYGEQILGDAPFLEMARHIARSHHEKFDGSGYPDGLRGTEIPLEARITEIADVYDALRSPRRYKKGFSHEEAMQIITIGDGRVEPSHFDPDVLNIFKKYHLEFSRIYEFLTEEDNT